MIINYDKKNERGFSLPMVLVVMMVFLILITSVFTMLQSNTKQIVVQEDNLRAYYLARSGVDLAYSAIMQQYDDSQLKIHRLIDEKDVIEHSDLLLPSDNPIGSVDIKVSFNEASNEVVIESNASVNDGPGTSKLIMYIEYDENNRENFTKIRWARE